MLQAERLKASRALPFHHFRPRDFSRIMTDQDRERKTDPVGTVPPESGGLDVAHGLMLPKAIAVEPQPDPNSYSDFVLSQLLTRSRELDAREAALDFGALLDKQAERIERQNSANYDGLRSSLTGIQQSVDALVTRVGNTEHQLDTGIKRFDGIDREILAIKKQMIELDAEIGRMKAEASREPTRTAPPEAQ